MTPHNGSFLRGLAEWLIVIVIACAATFLIRSFIIEPYVVPTGSMESTIEIGDQVLAEKVTVELGRGVRTGDIVVFHNPDSSSEHDVLVKRVVALGGQTVEMKDGILYVDGQALDEPYVAGESWPLAAQADGITVTFPYTVPEGSVWVMGDNRENSADSRYFGAVSQENIIGVVVLRYWPLNRFGTL